MPIGVWIQHWNNNKENPPPKEDPIIIVYFDKMVLVYWVQDGWNGAGWYSADEEMDYDHEGERAFDLWTEAPKMPTSYP